MLRFVTDENFNNAILRGLLRQNSDIDIVRVQDVGLSGVDDPDILEWSAKKRKNITDTSCINDNLLCP